MDSEYHYRAAKLMQTLEDIGKYHDFQSIFAESVNYKLVLSPFAKGELVTAQDIVFENEQNFVTLYRNGDGYQIPYSIIPANANFKTGITFTIKDDTVAYVTDAGVIYPKQLGSTYITLKLASGKVRTFFVSVSESFVTSAGIYNPCSLYTAQTAYTAVIYTAPCEEIALLDQNGNNFGQHLSSGKYCYHLTDAHGNSFQKWLVPLYAQEPGDYVISVGAREKKSEVFSNQIGSFSFKVYEKFGNEVSGALGAYTTRLDSVVSIYSQDNTLLETQTVKGGTHTYRFTNIPNGIYTIKIERDGYLPCYFKNIEVNGDTYVDDNIDSVSSFASCAGDFNHDEVIDIADVTLLLSAENYSLETEQAKAIVCDINGDSHVDILDLAAVVANI